MTKVSIIIPVKAVNDYIRQSVPKMLELDWPDFEIIIFPDLPDHKHHWPKTRIVPSGKAGPAEKRDLAIKEAGGEILAFLDDDAYPQPEWLKQAIPHFKNRKIAAVGGPAVTPSDDDWLQKLSGAVFESYAGGGGARNRYLPIGKSTPVYDWPTVNLLVRKDVFSQIGGFDNTYWPGEDTKLCLDILGAGYEIVYEPKAIVYHHRRSDLAKHFKQIGNYALHRGYFARIYPKTSRKLFYFAPSLFVLYLASFFLWPSLNQPYPLRMFYALPLFLYTAGLILDGVISARRWRNPLIGLLLLPMIFLTHLWYGLRFINGLLVKRLVK